MVVDWKKIQKEVMEWLKSISIVIVVMFVLSFFVQPTTVVGDSMNDSLINKDIVLLHVSTNLDYGDIISIKSKLIIEDKDIERLPWLNKLFAKKGSNKKIIKRVVALPGDRVAIKDGLLFVNDELVDDCYALGDTYPDVEVIELNEEQVFVLGDNREHSNDSRSEDIGLIKLDDIQGKTVVRIWPISRFGSVE